MEVIRYQHPKLEAGRVFGRLTVRSYAGKSKNQSHQYECDCDCGETTIVCGSSLTSGDTRSCSCLRRDLFESRREKISGRFKNLEGKESAKESQHEGRN